MLVVPDNVFLLIRVKSIVVFFLNLSISVATWEVGVASVLDALLDVEEVDDVVFHDLSLLVLPQVRGQNPHCLVSRHGELYLIVALATSVSLFRSR